MTQLPLPIGWSRHGGAESLLVHAANTDALALIRDWQRWPSPCTLLVGPSRSGRSLIAEVFLRESGGVLVDDADRADETHLFHLWNEARDSGRPLLMVASEAPPTWTIALPDLRTRLATAAVARILPPDEAVTAALIVHGLERAGSAFAPDLPDFLARRTARCYAAIEGVVAELNALSLARGQKLSVALARQALRNNALLDGADETAPHEGTH
ncbi:DnaA ATPase domain-containing protein [Sphingobium sp. B11D3A]|uniref:DnaA ATPase domain-containing protein n=1 Tax=Sphingobium sp. B11D3A TaxID=2940574 RepID=UPI00222470B6|nr:DnaA/Hda family protein [Sphingobium sp. B11D3A]MCW2390525.1 chromosomal replication initiation ATPase DnaA [Sphingobium sp. B11D3A]